MKNHFKIYEKVCGDLKPSGNGWFMTYYPYPDHEDKNGKPVSAGIYLYQIQAGEYISTKKMVLLK